MLNGPSPAARKPPLIAVVDDDRGARAAIANYIESLGMDVVTFGSSEEMLASDETDGVACLVSDVQLPGLNGLGLFRALLARGAAIPVVFVTGFPDGAVRDEALGLGACAFFAKPFEGVALRRSIEAALAKTS